LCLVGIEMNLHPPPPAVYPYSHFFSLFLTQALDAGWIGDMLDHRDTTKRLALAD